MCILQTTDMVALQVSAPTAIIGSLHYCAHQHVHWWAMRVSKVCGCADMCLCVVGVACSYPYLLFGLDAAVFESGQRRLPWQEAQPSPTVSEAGQKRSRQGAVTERAQRSTLLPHWVSHAQHTTTVEERDRAIRAIYENVAKI